METPILSIRNISKYYTGKTALDQVSIDIPRACIYGLLGPNGAGKTSLIRIINQITRQDTGDILFKGETLNASHIRKIGYLPEERGLYKKLKVMSQLLYFAELRGMSRREASEKALYWLEKMELLDVRNKKTEELSKGMQQKVQFIVAVIHQPELLILDEPFSGFDPVNAELLVSVILELKAAGSTIIFSTHRMESVEQLCDHMVMLNLSRKVLDGRVSDIRKQYTDGRFGIQTIGRLDFSRLDAECLSEHHTESGHWQYMVRLNGQGNSFLSACIAQTEIHSFSPHIPNIHDIFIQLVKSGHTL